MVYTLAIAGFRPTLFSLPAIRREVARLLTRYRQELKHLPQQPEEPSVEIDRHIRDFAIDFHDVVYAPGEDVHLAQSSQQRYKTFREEIQTATTVPDFQSMGLPSVRQYIQRLCLKCSWRDNCLDGICSSRGWLLPGTTPYAVKPKLIRMTTSLWQEPTLRCFDDIVELLSAEVFNLIKKHFGSFEELESMVKSVMYSGAGT